MKTKTTVLLALLVPGVAMLSACDRNKTGVDDAATPPAAATSDVPPTDSTMPADTMPADTTPADSNGTTPADKTFAQMDKNGDGSVTQDELDPGDMLSQHFSVADANGDGKLSEDEIAKHRADMAAAPAN